MESFQNVLVTAFNSFIRTVFDYGVQLLVAAPESKDLQLYNIQNRFPRLITGDAISTPIVDLELQTGISHFSDRRIYVALTLLWN